MVVLGSPASHICLIVIIRLCERAILVRLYYEVTSSGTRWSSCKPVVLVTLGGFHLLDGLVVVSIEARKKLIGCSREELCEGQCARPAGATKSNSSRARCEGRQVVQVLELVVSTPCGRV